MDSKKIDKADRKFIDELPQYRSKLARRQKVYSERPTKKGIRLPMVQVLAPVLIAVVGVVVIYLMPDKLPSSSQPKDSQVNPAQARQPQATASLAPSATGSDVNTPATRQPATQRIVPLKKTPQGKSSPVNPGKPKTETGYKTRNPATVEAASETSDEEQISLVSAVVCEGVQDHQPLDAKDEFFTADSRRVYVWMEIRSKSQPFVITHNYYLNGQKHSEVHLNIKYPRMRTWSYVTIDKPDHIGDWQVEIVHNDSILKTFEFRVSAGDK